jgi:hypothetical protein
MFFPVVMCFLRAPCLGKEERIKPVGDIFSLCKGHVIVHFFDFQVFFFFLTTGKKEANGKKG